MDTKDIEIKLMEIMSDVFNRETINNTDAKWIRDNIREAIGLVKKLIIPVVSVPKGTLCDKCYDTDGFYLGTTCSKCKQPFRSVKA